MNGERYLADRNITEVHDLDNERKECQIDIIINYGFEKPYESLNQAYWDGFRRCKHCIKNTNKPDSV